MFNVAIQILSIYCIDILTVVKNILINQLKT